METCGICALVTHSFSGFLTLIVAITIALLLVEFFKGA